VCTSRKDRLLKERFAAQRSLGITYSFVCFGGSVRSSVVAEAQLIKSPSDHLANVNEDRHLRH